VRRGGCAELARFLDRLLTLTITILSLKIQTYSSVIYAILWYTSDDFKLKNIGKEIECILFQTQYICLNQSHGAVPTYFHGIYYNIMIYHHDLTVMLDAANFYSLT